jgi:hypothetical protein
MSANEKDSHGPVGTKETASEASRRKLLKNLAAGGVVGAALPAVWSKPVIDSVILPAHAQTTGPGVIVGGGGGGGTGPGPAPSGSPGRDLIDFFVSPAQAGEDLDVEPCFVDCFPEPPGPQELNYCVEIRVKTDGSEVTEVTVTQYCLDEGHCGSAFVDVTDGSVQLKQSGNQWKGQVFKAPMVISNINVGPGGKLANVTWFGIPGILNKGASCDCSCDVKPA